MDEPGINNIKNFFSEWSTYNKLIHFNYMAHNEIYSELKKFFDETVKGYFDILDLGCGDCSHIPGTVDINRLRSYTGVDISPAALDDARRHLKEILAKVILVEDDFINNINNCENEKYDIVMTGYSVHHLNYKDKQTFFDNAYRVLKNGGYLVHYDVLRLENETREQYLNRYFDIMNRWDKLDPDDITSIQQHISDSDYPSTHEEVASMAVNSCFVLIPGKLFTDEHKIHTLSCFLKR